MHDTIKNATEKNPAVTRKELTNYILRRHFKYVNAIQAKEFVDTFFDALIEGLIGGKTIKLPCFGTFSVVDKKSRPGRNPRTGTEVEIEARRVVRFRSSKKLRTKQDQKD